MLITINILGRGAVYDIPGDRSIFKDNRNGQLFCCRRGPLCDPAGSGAQDPRHGGGAGISSFCPREGP